MVPNMRPNGISENKLINLKAKIPKDKSTGGQINYAITYGGAFNRNHENLDKDFCEEERDEFDTKKKGIRTRKLRIKLEKQKKAGIIPEDLQR